MANIESLGLDAIDGDRPSHRLSILSALSRRRIVIVELDTGMFE